MIVKARALMRRLLRSEDGGRLAGNFSYLMILQVAGYFFPLVTIPYLARVVGVDGIGKIAFASAIIVWFKAVVDWGFDYTATRDVAQCRNEPEKVAQIFSNVLWARALLTVVSFLVLLALIETVPYLRENRLVLLATFMLVPGRALFPEWFFQATERMKFITIFSLFAKAVATGLVFVFINEESDFVLQPLFVSLGYCASGVAAMYVVLVRWKLKIERPNWRSIAKIIKGGADVFLNTILPNLYNSFSVVLLGFWGGATANGLYDAGRKFVYVAQSLSTVMVRAAFPFLSRRLDKHKLFTRIYLSVAAMGALFLFVFSRALIEVFYTGEFEGAVTVLRLTSVSVFFVALIKAYGTGYLIIKGRERALRNTTLLCSLFGLFIALPLIYKFSYIGAAFAVIVTQALLGFSLFRLARAIEMERRE